LHIYRRHRAECKHRDQRVSRECRCPLWAKGQLEGKPYQRSLKTRSIKRAEQILRNIQDGNSSTLQPKSIKDALAAFIADCRARNLNERTFKKYELLQTRLQDFCADRRISNLSEFTHEQAVAFRASWKGAPLTLSKTLERARSAGKFFFQNGWLPKNPFEGIKPPKVKPNPRLPFSEKEIQNITAKAKDDRELAFLLVLRHTGLRIGDASLLRVSQVSEARVHLYTTKAGTSVSVVIPPNLASLLRILPTRGGHYFLWGESTHVHSVSNLWRRRIKAICKDLKITPDHPHRFRHSLAADLLTKGASVEQVAAILGNSPAIVVKHYSQWIKSRQGALDSFLETTWKPALSIVKK